MAVLQVYHEGAAYRIQLELEPIDDSSESRLAFFRATVCGVVRDAVGYARLANGPVIKLVDSVRVVARWQQQVAAIRALVPSRQR
jgi:hypothetical protein